MQIRALASFIDLGFACESAHAALVAQENRVVQPVDPDQRVALSERRAGWISPANDAGAVPADLPLTSLSIALKRSDARQQAFEQLLKDQQDPASPDYHHWLSASEIGPDDLIDDALVLFDEYKITSIFVVKDDGRGKKPVGVLHIHDCPTAR